MAKYVLPSLDLALEETRKRLDIQFEQINNLDTKASIALVATGVVLAALLGTLSSGNIDIGSACKLIISAIVLIFLALALAVVGLWIKKYERPPKPERLRDYYIAVDEQSTKLHIIDVCLEAIRNNHKRLVWKIGFIKFSYIALSLGAACTVGLIFWIT